MRYALAIEYDGSAYCGWQRQKHCKSIQEVVESALSTVANEIIEVTCCGRTDSGVHAVAQYVHFDTLAQRPDKAWVMGVNHLTGHSISVRWAGQVADHFHARYSTLERRYRYVILNRKAKPGLDYGRVAWVTQLLNEESMHSAARYLIGEFDFSAFRAAGCQAKHAIREIKSIEVTRQGERVIVDICANAFLHNMVRIIVGSLIKVGKGEREPLWIQQVLIQKDRTLGGVTAVPDGLYFLGPRYPEEFRIPQLDSSV